MNKRLLTQPNYDVRNAALEGAIEDCAADRGNPKTLEILIRLFREAQVIVPVSFPKDADQKAVMKLLSGQALSKGENVPFLPVTLTSPEGKKYAPVFTSRDQIQDTNDFPYMVRIDAAQVVRNVQNENLDLEGVLINPQGRGFIIRKKAFELDFSKQPAGQHQQVVQVKKEDFPALARQTAEKVLIPKRLFDDPAAFVKELETHGEEVLGELYAQPYADKMPCPYTADDFSLMSLGIDENTTAISVELPVKGGAPHLGTSAYVVWNEAAKKAYYFLIEKGENEQDDRLCRVTPDGKHEELRSAPPVGSELTTILEWIQQE